MRAKQPRVQPDAPDPIRRKPGVLACRHAMVRTWMPGEQELASPFASDPRIACSIGALPASAPARPISTMHTAKTPGVRQPQRNRFLLRPIVYYRHYGPAAWIDPVVLGAITISWNNIVIPVRSCLYHGHPDDRPFPWLTNDLGVLRMRCDTKYPRVAHHQGGSESERYGHYPHALASLPHSLDPTRTSGDVRLRAAVVGISDIKGT